MSIAGLLIGFLNCLIVAVVLVLVGAVVAWIAAAFDWPIPWNIQRLYLLVVLLVFIACFVSLLLGMPMVHILGHAAQLHPLLA